MNIFIFIFYALAIACLLATGGICRPLAGVVVESARAGDQQPGQVHIPARREKRCSCSNMQDTECVYFCHVGIVWVNTPGQLVPYGLGHPVMRRKRELRRCLCAKSSDAECQSYCRLVSREPRHVRDTRVRMLWKPVGKRARKATGEAALQGDSWDVEE
ncbi:endothelin-1 [Hypanus sabinus]|uniref:endothelin-1 n=1 Tax=Hypanus sabinus TaxID=79690 RepID=UPI0028C41640|nr:endothelin-1 [Hypanus sabinus]